MQQFSSSNTSNLGQSESSYVANATDGVASNSKPNKLKPAMMTLSGHSCVKSPANLAPLPIQSKKSHQFKTEKDAEYFATDDFAEFEDFEEHDDQNEDNTIIHTPPSTNTTNTTNNNYQQQQQQLQNNNYQYNINNSSSSSSSCYYGGGGGGAYNNNNNNNNTQQFYHHSQYQQMRPNPNPNPNHDHINQYYTNKYNENQNQNQNQNQNVYDNYTLQQQYNYVALQQQQQPQQSEYKQESNILKEKLLEAQLCHEDKVKRGSIHFPSSDLCGRYSFIRYLGHGSYGHVCEARSLLSKHNCEAVAIKKVPHVFRNITDAKRLLRELVILRTVKQHEAIITLIDILPPNDIENFDTLYLVFEFVDTDLSQLINSPQNFEKLHAQYIIYQILLGLQYLHSANICHRDLKPANILVNENVSTKICDFGLARGISENINCISQKLKAKSHSKMQIKKEFNVNTNTNTNTNVKGEKRENNKNNNNNKNEVRQLTKHVVTRWYRAPEVILFSQRREYLTAIDMWSVGCILSELLMMIGDDGNFKQRQPLFPGRSCFPLSARDPEAYKDNFDQLNCIFSVIGTPTPDEIAKIKDKQARAYLEKLAKNSFQKPLDLNRKFKNASKQELDLLRRLLQFDVEKRITVDQALSHPYLEDVRDLQAELRHKKVIFEFEDVALNIKTIYELIVDEICQYNPNLLSDLL